MVAPFSKCEYGAVIYTRTTLCGREGGWVLCGGHIQEGLLSSYYDPTEGGQISAPVPCNSTDRFPSIGRCHRTDLALAYISLPLRENQPKAFIPQYDSVENKTSDGRPIGYIMIL